MNLSWIDAIVKVMEENGTAMHYTDIAEKIISQALRDKIGATPAATVSYNLSISINNDGSKSPFIRTTIHQLLVFYARFSKCITVRH